MTNKRTSSTNKSYAQEAKSDCDGNASSSGPAWLHGMTSPQTSYRKDEIPLQDSDKPYSFASADTFIELLNAPIEQLITSSQFPDTWLRLFQHKPNEPSAHLLRLSIIKLREKHSRGDTRKRGDLTEKALGKAISDHVRWVCGDDTRKEAVVRRYPHTKLSKLETCDVKSFGRVVTSLLQEEGTTRPDPIVIEALTQYLIDKGFLKTDAYAHDAMGVSPQIALHRALCEFFLVSPRTESDLLTKFVGTYFVYRKSAHWPGAIIKGVLEISLSSTEFGSTALLTTERHIHHGEDGSAPASETYIGVMSRKSGYPFIVSSIQSANRRRGAPRFSLIFSTVFDGVRDHVASMTGLTVSPYGEGQCWSSPVCIERVLGNVSDDQLGLFLPADELNRPAELRRIPASVIARLAKASANNEASF